MHLPCISGGFAPPTNRIVAAACASRFGVPDPAEKADSRFDFFRGQNLVHLLLQRRNV
jgi:hypothetical protein